MERVILGDFSMINEKQKLFLSEKNHKHIAYGGARGGGKSWAVRAKAKLLAVKYPGIRMLIVRRTYAELLNNHINILRTENAGAAVYNDREKVLRFFNGSTLNFMYCAKDKDLDRLQGVEYDVIFLDEATQLSEFQMKAITACVRGVNDFPKRIYYTCNPGGQGHGYIKRLFIDRVFEPGEDPDEYIFFKALATDNKALMKSQPDYVKQLEALPEKLKQAWLYGNWDIFDGQFFSEFRDDPQGYMSRQWSHVIEPFAPTEDMAVYRSYDFGYHRPFSCAWWAVDREGVLYRILELYGCSATPNEGIHWSPDRQFAEIARIESEHPWLKDRHIRGVADPSIWDTSRGESIARTAEKYGIFFEPGDNKRIAGWMQCHYRLTFDENGYSMMYVFRNCRAFIRTVPLLLYSENVPEDLDTSLEDHVADEWRYMCMSRPIPARAVKEETAVLDDPLNMVQQRKNRCTGGIYDFRRQENLWKK